MGGIRKPRKQYSSPRKRWDKARIEKEKKIVETYGLKNKRELRRVETILRKKRENARRLLALPSDRRLKAEKELFESIVKTGLLPRNASVDDVLSLQVEELLEKRLSTLVWRKNFAKTIKQARQFITHGHIAVNGKKITSPSYLVRVDEADKIGYHKRPMQIEPPKEETKAGLKKEFEEALPEENENGAKEETTGEVTDNE